MRRLAEISCAWSLILLGLFVFVYIAGYLCLYRGIVFLETEGSYSAAKCAAGSLQIILFLPFTYTAFLILKFEGRLVDYFLERRKEC